MCTAAYHESSILAIDSIVVTLSGRAGVTGANTDDIPLWKSPALVTLSLGHAGLLY